MEVVPNKLDEHNLKVKALKEKKNSLEAKIKQIKKENYELTIEEKNEIKNLGRQIKEINKTIAIEKKYLRLINADLKRREISLAAYEPFLLTKKQELLLKYLKEHQIAEINLKDLVAIYKYALINIQSFNDDFFNNVHLYFMKMIMTKGELSELNELKCWVNHFIYEEKESASETDLKRYRNLKKTLRQLDSFKEVKEEPSQAKNNILGLLLENKEYFPYFRRLIKAYPELASLEIAGYSLAVYLNKMYIENYLIKLKNQSSDYLEPELIKQTYFFVCDVIGDEKKEDSDIILSDLIKFQNYVKKKKYQKEPLEQTLNNITEMLECRYLSSIKYLETDKIVNSLNSELLFYATKIKEKGFIFENNEPHLNYAYTVEPLGEDYLLKIHVTDMNALIGGDSPVYNYLLNNLKFTNKVNDLIRDEVLNSYFALQQGTTRRVITFALTIMKTGRVRNFQIYPSLLTVTDAYTYDDLKKPNSDLKLLTTAYYCLNHHKKTNESLGYAINQKFEKTLNNLVGETIAIKRLPFLYRSDNALTNEKYHMQTLIAHELWNLEDEDFKKFYEVLTSDRKTRYYSLKNSGHKNLNYAYYMDILNPLDNLCAFFLQGVLKGYFINNNLDKDTAKKFLTDLAYQANYKKVRMNYDVGKAISKTKN